MEARQRSIGGHTVRWLEHGTGAPVILVHGIPTSPRLWRHVMPLMAGRSLAWEMPGYGRSMPEGRNRDLGLGAQAGYLLYPAFVQLIHRGHDDHRMALDSLGEHRTPYVTHGAAAAMMAQVRALDVQDTLDIAGQPPALGLPARVVWGVADRFQKLPYGERLAADLDTELIRIGGGKHLTPEDHPRQVAAAVNALFD